MHKLLDQLRALDSGYYVIGAAVLAFAAMLVGAS